MFIYYRTFGLIADIALMFNLLLTVAILSALGATLTLPGVAGLALTLGISVDASVIIFERIKEEMGKGATLAGAIREGYDRAFSSILDSNLTSIAVCVVLMYFGTGPVRGFAVTLLTGLVITTFTAVFFTRSVLDLLVVKWKRDIGISFLASPKVQAKTAVSAH
jgi:preprotein translocase subunit SecD